jgi:hypothetical protein
MYYLIKGQNFQFARVLVVWSTPTAGLVAATISLPFPALLLTS